MTDDELVQLGLCDADKLNTSRPAFVRMLLDEGATVEEILEASKTNAGGLAALATSMWVFPPGRTPAHEVMERVGVSAEDVRTWWRYVGWPDPTLPGSALNEYEIRFLEILAERFPMGLLPDGVIADYLRTTATSIGDIAESMLNTMRIGLDQPAREAGMSAFAVSKQHRDVLVTLMPDFFEALTILFRAAVIAGAREAITTNRGGEVWSERTMVFVDIVDYSSLSRGASHVLRDVLDHFEASVSTYAHDYGGRLVKLLGDGAMLTFATRDAGIRAAVALAQDASLPPCRAGVATGSVLMRHADFFGPVVNLASRLSSVVGPGEVAVDDTLEVPDAEHMAPTLLKGLDAPVTPYRIVACPN